MLTLLGDGSEWLDGTCAHNHTTGTLEERIRMIAEIG